MKTDTQILNEIALNSPFLHQLTAEESSDMKKLLLIMLKDISETCEHNGLTYMLGAGSCLGAIRHKGFIPWDDDLDIMMPRKDYESLIRLLEAGKLGDKYEYNTPKRNEDCKNTFLKIYRKGTLDNELYNENTSFPKGIYIDIFPMDSAPKNKFQQSMKAIISDILKTISICVLYAQYPSMKYKEFVYSAPNTKKRYKIRLMIGNVFKIIPHRLWVYWFDKFNSSTKDTGFTTIPTGRKHYKGEIQPTDVFLPVKYEMFEGIKCPIPGNTHAYLSSLYGDYMTLPPEDKRERHFVYQFKCELPK